MPYSATNAAQRLGAGATSSTATDGCLIQKPTAVLLSPMQLSCLRDCPPIRALLLGTTDPGSVLYRLPKSDGVLNIILRFVVLFYEEEVPALTCALIRDNVCAGQQGQSVQGSEARQPDAVADDARGVLCV